MWNAWTAPPGALPRDFDPWSCEAHCARCGELAQDCHCEDEDDMSDWQPINSAPKDGTRIDIWAKSWRADDDGFFYRRFPDCYWTKGDSMTNRGASWVHLEVGWYPTHWMPVPAAPGEDHTS